MDFALVKILLLGTLSFLVALAWNPLLIKFLHKYKMGKQIRDAASAPVFSAMHQKKSGTPTMGGVLIWVTVLGIALLFALIDWLAPQSTLARFNFLSQSQTYLPLGALVASALVGMVDDYWNIRRWGPKGGGISMMHRLLIYSVIAAFGAWWFYAKLDWDLLRIPFLGEWNIGWWYIPVFFFVIVASAFSVNEADGLDGLAGGTLLIAFFAYAAIAALEGKYDIATFLAVLCGALLAFLWHNINPAKYFMGDTGAMSMGVVLGILAMLTNTVFLLPIIGIIFVVETVTVMMQMTSKKLLKKKIFISTPIHHHFEAIGWPEPQIVMRAWVVAMVAAALGLALFVADRALL